MCGRFTLTLDDLHALAESLGVPLDSLPAGWVAKFNIAPTDLHFIVHQQREDRVAQVARWGLVNASATDNKRAAQQINARAETLARRPAYRAAFESRRCVVPADGFYEWSGPKQARQPHWFHPPRGGLLLLAGLYETWRAAPDHAEVTFTIITTTANAVVASIHDRMPVILNDEQADTWLYARSEPATLQRLLAPPPPEALTVREANPLVNSVRNQGPKLLIPPARLL